MTPSRITLLTDFGTRDGYVAAMKGVIAAIQPDAAIDDASHDIQPGDMVAAAFALRRYWKAYPPRTVHAVVVDPGVGSARRAIAAWCDDRYLVGPDNGVLSLVLRDADQSTVIAIQSSTLLVQAVSATFHGRDIFAPIAAHLASGIPLSQLGTEINDAVGLHLPQPTASRGEVVYIDHFGNLVTNIDAPTGCVVVGSQRIDVKRTYSDVAVGEVVGLINSDGVLEIAIRNGNAARELNLARGAPVRLER